MTVKSLIRHFINKSRPAVFPFFLLANRMRADKEWVLVLGGRSYARELTQQLAELGNKVFLFDAAPISMNWRFAAGMQVLDIYDIANIPLIVETARRLGCPVVMMQSDDNLLPVYAEVNRQLENSVRFSKAAVQASLDKEVMRERLAAACMTLPVWAIVEDDAALDGLPLPGLIKPRIGQGSKGVVYVETLEEARAAKAFIREEMDQDSCLYEEFLTGRQFNIEGVIQDGHVYFHMITEECFTDFMPLFKPAWYLFGPTLPPEMEAEILRETRAALAACDLQSGAFHLELKFKGDVAHAFDLSNRMPADFPRYTKLVTGIAPVEDYAKAMTGGVLEARSLGHLPGQQRLRFYNYPERPAHAKIRDLARSLATKDDMSLFENGYLLEMTGKEAALRDFLESAYAFRHHD